MGRRPSGMQTPYPLNADPPPKADPPRHTTNDACLGTNMSKNNLLVASKNFATEPHMFIASYYNRSGFLRSK